MTKVSVIMPAYNSVTVVRKALESLQAQTFSDFEAVVVDDCSTDGTYEAIQSMAQEDSRIRFFRTPRNSGSSIARQIALEKAIGEWITLLDADDWYEPDRIDILLKAAYALKADMVIDNLQIFDHALNRIVEHTNYGARGATVQLTVENLFRLDNPLRRSSIGYSQPLINTKFLRDHKINYWGKYRNNEDFILFAEIVLSGAKTYIIPEAYYVYVHRISPTTRKVSPHSHSANDTALLIADACDDLMEKYGGTISTKVGRRLLHRKKIFLTSRIAREQKRYFLQRQYVNALKLFFTCPYLITYRAVGLQNRIYTTLMSVPRYVQDDRILSAKIRFSLILATINRTTELERFLTSVVAQKYPDVDVIIVDQNPPGFLDAIIARFRETLSINHIRSAPGLSRARNAGLQHADGEIIAFPDDDCIYPPGLLSKVSSVLVDSTRYDGFVAAPFSPDGRPVLRHWPTAGKVTRRKIFRQAISFGVFLRRNLVEQVGRFDETLGVGAGTLWGSGEETDFLLRALNKNACIAYDPNVRVLHEIPPSPDPPKTASYARGLGRVARKNHYNLFEFAPFILKPTLAALFCLATGKFERCRSYITIARSRWEGFRSQSSPAQSDSPTNKPTARVSVLMPAYNAIKTIRRALEALQAQTFSDLELVVVDDQSTDGTYALVQEMARTDPRIKLFQTSQNLGNGGASRTAMEKATGEWITILDADDWCEANRIGALLKAATALNADMVIDNLQILDHALNRVVKRTNYGSSREITELSAEDLFRLDNPLRRNSVGYSKPMMRTKFLREHNINYWGKYRDNEDFILLSEIVLSGAKAFIIPDAYYVYVHRISPTTRRVSPTSFSADDTALLVAQASDELMEKYQSVISAKARRALLRRKEIFMTSRVAGKQTSLVLQGHYGKAAILFLEHPSLVAFRMIGVLNRIGVALRVAI